MKKIVSITLALIMMLALASTVFAAEAQPSPTGSAYTKVVSSTPADAGCTGKVVLISYNNRASLSADKKALLEKAFAALTTDAVAKFGNGLKCADIFDLSIEGCADHAAHANKAMTVVLGAERIDAVLHFNGSVWEKVNGANISADKKSATFTGDDFSPYAVLTLSSTTPDGSTEPKSPQTNDLSVYFLVAGCAFAAVAVAFIAVSKKKSFEK